MTRIETDSELNAALQAKGATAVLFHATWCPFCRSFRPVYDRVMASTSGYNVVEAVIDDEENPLWTKYGIDAVPTVVFFEGGRPVKRLDAKLGVGLTEQMLRGAVR